MITAAGSDRGRRRLVALVVRPFLAVWRFGHWVRHSQADVEALYGRNPNQITDREKALKAALILRGISGSGPTSGFGGGPH